MNNTTTPNKEQTLEMLKSSKKGINKIAYDSVLKLKDEDKDIVIAKKELDFYCSLVVNLDFIIERLSIYK